MQNLVHAGATSFGASGLPLSPANHVSRHETSVTKLDGDNFLK